MSHNSFWMSISWSSRAEGWKNIWKGCESKIPLLHFNSFLEDNAKKYVSIVLKGFMTTKYWEIQLDHHHWHHQMHYPKMIHMTLDPWIILANKCIGIATTSIALKIVIILTQDYYKTIKQCYPNEDRSMKQKVQYFSCISRKLLLLS